MKTAITVPDYAKRKKDLENPCPCQEEPVKMTYKTGTLFWLKKTGEHVKKDEPVCEAEVEKATLELISPCEGILLEKSVQDNESFSYGQILGYIGS